MDLNDLKRKVQAARRFQVEVEGRTFTLQRPSRFELQMAGARAGMSAGEPGSRVHWERLVLLGAIVGWDGVLACDLGAGDFEPVPHSPEAVPMLVDAQPDWADTLATALWVNMAKAEDAEGTASKN